MPGPWHWDDDFTRGVLFVGMMVAFASWLAWNKWRRRRKGGGGPTDPYFANVVLLCHFDGSNGATTATSAVGVDHAPEQVRRMRTPPADETEKNRPRCFPHQRRHVNAEEEEPRCCRSPGSAETKEMP